MRSPTRCPNPSLARSQAQVHTQRTCAHPTYNQVAFIKASMVVSHSLTHTFLSVLRISTGLQCSKPRLVIVSAPRFSTSSPATFVAYSGACTTSHIAVDETVILLHPPLPLVGVSIVIEI